MTCGIINIKTVHVLSILGVYIQSSVNTAHSCSYIADNTSLHVHVLLEESVHLKYCLPENFK